ncbi:hypothetical protein JZ751_005472 [Albula glossodonta]|uniref:SH2 domain-containing protein n=1 Tax=Albula glossodonta TaxID=121402 RepID=A0A8T2MP59_9TELE|nr:hypothetical protein JZ751_005472 [Albula glossodonta]
MADRLAALNDVPLFPSHDPMQLQLFSSPKYLYSGLLPPFPFVQFDGAEWERSSSPTERLRPPRSSPLGGATKLRKPTDPHAMLGERVDPTLPLEKQVLTGVSLCVPGNLRLTNLHSRWYHGALSRSEAEALLTLCKECSYLVRNSQTSRTDFSLSLRPYPHHIHTVPCLAQLRSVTQHNAAYQEKSLPSNYCLSPSRSLSAPLSTHPPPSPQVLIKQVKHTPVHTKASAPSCQGFMHMKFTVSKEGKYVLGQNSPPFDTIPEVIHYYTTHKLPIRGAEHLSLLFPVLVQTL